MKCRYCATAMSSPFLDLGTAPPSNAYLTIAQLRNPETWYPLRLRVCEVCWLVQTEDFVGRETMFDPDYAYFSSTSKSWLAHASEYVKRMIEELALTQASHVVEVASNDGYLLRNFVDAGIPCLGVEPTASTARHAESLGIPVRREFFGENLGKQLTEQGLQADLIIGNNVYAHVPDITDFTLGLKASLKPRGIITLEFPHVLRLLEGNQFDTVYHEHYSYLSFYTVQQIFEACGLRIYHVEELETHGGSLRVFGCHKEDVRRSTSAVHAMLSTELDRGLRSIGVYAQLQATANLAKDELLEFLISKKRGGSKVAAYGAAAKGNTLLNFAGVKSDLLPFVCDAAPSKQGKYTPGSRIPIFSADVLNDYQPDYLLVLPWNILSEVKAQLKANLKTDVQYVTAIPSLTVDFQDSLRRI